MKSGGPSGRLAGSVSSASSRVSRRSSRTFASSSSLSFMLAPRTVLHKWLCWSVARILKSSCIELQTAYQSLNWTGSIFSVASNSSGSFPKLTGATQCTYEDQLYSVRDRPASIELTHLTLPVPSKPLRKSCPRPLARASTRPSGRIHAAI